MSEKEKKIAEKVGEALPKMSEMDKGYFLGYAEAIASLRSDEKEEDRKEDLEDQNESI